MITAFGVARADGIVLPRTGVGAGGNLYWRREVASGFIIYVEMAVPPAGFPIDSSTLADDPSEDLPGFQISSTHALGDGSVAVCDDGPAPGMPIGGVPAIPDANFAANPSAVNDLSCRFDVRTLNGTGPCTRMGTGAEQFVDPDSTIQFCAGFGSEIAFPMGQTTLTARGRDILGRPGPNASIIIVVPEQ